MDDLNELDRTELNYGFKKMTTVKSNFWVRKRDCKKHTCGSGAVP